MALCPDCARFLFQLCAYAPAGACSCAVRNTAMPLPVADEGIAGLLQRSENRRNNVSPNDSPGTAKRIVEGFSSQRLSAVTGRRTAYQSCDNGDCYTRTVPD